MNSQKNLAKKVMCVADAFAMNAVPEYWWSIKQAGMLLVSAYAVAKQLIQ